MPLHANNFGNVCVFAQSQFLLLVTPLDWLCTYGIIRQPVGVIKRFVRHPAKGDLDSNKLARGRSTMKPVEIVEVEMTNVSCDGDCVLGHPRIFLNMGDNLEVDCPYCGRRFALKEGVTP
jgi:uncharacterized Zn-finger protein